MVTREPRLYMVQVNGRYGENVYLPYSAGLLWAYAKRDHRVSEAYDFCGFLYLKEKIEDAVSKLDSPDLVGISCYIWNWEWSKSFAKAVKDRWPKCKVLVGGVQIQDESTKSLDEYEHFDFAIYGEGEGAFTDFLIEHSKSVPEYERCESLVWRGPHGVVVNRRKAFADINNLRSPYLDGVFDSILDSEPRWQVLQETNRGCPYDCSMCAWGAAGLSKIRQFPLDRVRDEIDWFGQHNIDYLDNADANYGIVRRDIELTKALVETKAKYGFPRTFRTSFAKNSNEVIWEIAQMLHGAKMLKSVTLAMQSMDDNVLVSIRRKNIKFDKFSDYVRRYEEVGIPTYTELILGLADETYDTFVDGIERNLEAGQHYGLFVYLNLMLNNTEQSTTEYINRHGIKARTLLAMLTHGTPDNSVVREKQEVVVETAAMSHTDWKKAYLFSKVVEVFHSQGLLRKTAIRCHEAGVQYRDFYERLLTWLRNNPQTVGAEEIFAIERLLDRALEGGVWDCVDEKLGDISWPPEEFAFARICLGLDRFYDELAPFFDTLPNGATLIAEQRQEIVPPERGREVEWARDVVWYGRKGSGSKLLKKVV